VGAGLNQRQGREKKVVHGPMGITRLPTCPLGMGRKAFLMVLAPLYCDVIVRRWEKFTGPKAQRGELPTSHPFGVLSSEGCNAPRYSNPG